MSDDDTLDLKLTTEQHWFETGPKTGAVIAENAVFDIDGTPRVSIRKTATSYTATIEIMGLAPTRAPSLEENVHLGIRSFDPPTVFVKRTRDPAKAIRTLIDTSVRAVQSASTSTTGETGGPGALLMIATHVTRGVRGALRFLAEDV